MFKLVHPKAWDPGALITEQQGLRQSERRRTARAARRALHAPRMQQQNRALRRAAPDAAGGIVGLHCGGHQTSLRHWPPGDAAVPLLLRSRVPAGRALLESPAAAAAAAAAAAWAAGTGTASQRGLPRLPPPPHPPSRAGKQSSSTTGSTLSSSGCSTSSMWRTSRPARGEGQSGERERDGREQLDFEGRGGGGSSGVLAAARPFKHARRNDRKAPAPPPTRTTLTTQQAPNITPKNAPPLKNSCKTALSSSGRRRRRTSYWTSGLSASSRSPSSRRSPSWCTTWSPRPTCSCPTTTRSTTGEGAGGKGGWQLQRRLAGRGGGAAF